MSPDPSFLDAPPAAAAAGWCVVRASDGRTGSGFCESFWWAALPLPTPPCFVLGTEAQTRSHTTDGFRVLWVCPPPGLRRVQALHHLTPAFGCRADLSAPQVTIGSTWLVQATPPSEVRVHTLGGDDPIKNAFAIREVRGHDLWFFCFLLLLICTNCTGLRIVCSPSAR